MGGSQSKSSSLRGKKSSAFRARHNLDHGENPTQPVVIRGHIETVEVGTQENLEHRIAIGIFRAGAAGLPERWAPMPTGFGESYQGPWRKLMRRIEERPAIHAINLSIEVDGFLGEISSEPAETPGYNFSTLELAAFQRRISRLFLLRIPPTTLSRLCIGPPADAAVAADGVARHSINRALRLAIFIDICRRAVDHRTLRHLSLTQLGCSGSQARYYIRTAGQARNYKKTAQTQYAPTGQRLVSSFLTWRFRQRGSRSAAIPKLETLTMDDLDAQIYIEMARSLIAQDRADEADGPIQHTPMLREISIGGAAPNCAQYRDEASVGLMDALVRRAGDVYTQPDPKLGMLLNDGASFFVYHARPRSGGR
jgi:hypothetical protein